MSQKKSIIFLLLLINWVDLAVLNKKTDIEGLLKAIQLELEDKTEPIDEIETESNAFDFCQSLVRCEKGENLVRRANVIPTYNGCGSYGFIIDFRKYNAEELTLCCNSHDLCYGDCYNGKTNCDTAFSGCLKNACDRMSFSQEWNQIENFGCLQVVKLMYKAVKNLGCLAYVKGINKSCMCIFTRNNYNIY